MTRHLAIGDIHGCYNALRTLIDFVVVESTDVVVTLGDYVDRGPQTRDVIDLLISLQEVCSLVALRGNHEVMMENARVNAADKIRWGKFGGIATLDSYCSTEVTDPDFDDIPDAHWSFISGLLPFFENESHIFVHAHLSPSVPLAEQSERLLFWDQYSVSFPGHVSGKFLVCGHNSQDSGIPIGNSSSICIDTGAYKGGWLSCLCVESGTLWQANERGETRRHRVVDLITSE